MTSALTPAGSTRAWRRLRLVVLDRDGWRCQHAGQQPAHPGSWAAVYAPPGWPRNAAGRALVCGAYADHADHVVPRKADDPHPHPDALDNLRANCPDHNLSRGKKPDPATTTTPSSRRRAGWEWG